ncbi:recombinase family protein [Bacillus altitudinis]|uniref:recombinase family protein n=1 Tax=Bacillus altitudinis TaxID=293387 RepID=UPI0022831B72|nr:recombinase family protein [Bacillus altitudinis]MCY7716970.1 recombinase family protein [Bacillus altitudinis]
MRCAVYARVSTGLDSQKTSIPSQIKLFENYIKEKGWELYKVYSDVQSASKSNRSGGIQDLIQDAKDKKFDVVLSKEISRISRNGIFSYEFKNILLLNQIHVITLDGAINSMEDNFFNFGLFVWMAEAEAARTSKRIKVSYEVRAKSGRFDDAPYGYDLEDGKLYISRSGSAEVVQRIYKEYIAGKSFDAIGRSLFNEGVPTPAQEKGHKNSNVFWHGSTIRQILEREVYIGCLVAKKTSTISPTTTKRIVNKESDWIVIENTHEPIISKEDFALVQQLIKSRKRIRSQQSTHLFTGLLVCGNCGAGMHFKRDRYVCGNQNKHGKKACPDNFRPIEKELVQVLLNDLNTIYFSNVSVASTEKLLDNNLKKLNSKSVNNHEKLQKQLASLRTKKQKALDLLLDDKINQEDYDGLVATLNPEIEKLVEQLNLLQYEESNMQVDVANLKAYILNQLNPKRPLTDLTPTILARFIHKITAKADGQLEVHYRTSKPSAFYVSANIKLAIPKTHPNKTSVKKHA